MTKSGLTGITTDIPDGNYANWQENPIISIVLSLSDVLKYAGSFRLNYSTYDLYLLWQVKWQHLTKCFLPLDVWIDHPRVLKLLKYMILIIRDRLNIVFFGFDYITVGHTRTYMYTYPYIETHRQLCYHISICHHTW